MTVRLITFIALIRGYRLGFLFVFLALAILLLIAPVLLHIEEYSDYFFGIRSGFVPEFYAEFQPHTDVDELRARVADGYPEATTYTGVVCRTEDVCFKIEDGSSLKRPTTFLGIDFDGYRALNVQADGKTQACSVDGVAHMGSWLFTLGDCSGLPSGEAVVQLDETQVVGELYADEHESIFVLSTESDLPEEALARQKFLGHFFQKYFSVEKSGIGMDRFLPTENRSEFEVFQQRPMQAFADIVFNGSEDDLPVLLSDRLMTDVGDAGIGQFAQISSGSKLSDVRVVDSFSFAPEGKLNPYLVLGSRQTVTRIAPAGSEQHPVLLVQGVAGDTVGLQTMVSERYPDAVTYTREDLLPSFLLQKKYVQIAQAILLAFILIIPPLILFVKLFRFYVANNDQIILLSLYGFRWPIFSSVTVFIAFLAYVASMLVAEVLFKVNNDVLKTYFFPEVPFDLTRSLIVAGYVALVILVVFLVEISLLRRIRYAERGTV